MKEEPNPTCQSCQYSVIEYLTQLEEDEPLIMGIDYQYRCKLHDIIVEYNDYCDDFELPF